MLVVGTGAGLAWAQTEGANAASVKFATLHSFNNADGLSSWALVQATDGDLYGTTPGGGANNLGTVFKIGLLGKLTTLYNFCSQTGCTDGEEPTAGLVQATNGDFYGTAVAGGISNPFCPYGTCGTVFKITPDGMLTTLYRFCSQPSCADGIEPVGGLVQAANGDLYGTTSAGGAINVNPKGGGTIFKITPSGTLTTLYSFCAQSGCTDGGSPSASLIQARDGNLYGNTGYLSSGTIFKITPRGKFTTIYKFCSQSGCTDGDAPAGPLVQAANGNLYGTTLYGGVTTGLSFGGGTIFEITPGGQLTTLYSFCAQSGCPDGYAPNSGMIQASDGNFYGTALFAGANMNAYVPGGSGTLFQLSPSGTFTTLYNFCAQANCADGFGPSVPLIQDSVGIIYGTTLWGGADGNNQGTIFALSTGALPFVITRPAIGVRGEIVTILGYGLKGATSVTFNGTPAKILYAAPTVIYTLVPAGATTGQVQVVTPNGALTSNVTFEVVP